MARRLPSLNALKAFEAAQRHGSFTDAAAELFVTHAAISRHIRSLEEELGVALFQRIDDRCRIEVARSGDRQAFCGEVDPRLADCRQPRDRFLEHGLRLLRVQSHRAADQVVAGDGFTKKQPGRGDHPKRRGVAQHDGAAGGAFHHRRADIERGDDAVKFLAAEMSALRFALSHRDETIALTRELTHAKPDDPRPAFVYDDAIQHNAVDPTLPLPAEKIQWIQDQMVKAGRLKAPLDLKTVTAPEYREKALQVVGH